MAVMQSADTSKLTGKTQEMLAQFDKTFGLTPNVLKQVANSPAALEAFLSAREALGKGALTDKMRAIVGIVIAETYSCEYLLSARVAMAKKAGMTDEELKLARDQTSKDAKDDAGIQFVRNLILRHGELAPSDLEELRTAGYNDGEIVELISHSSMNMFIYYMCQVAQPEADFPKIATAFPV
jgi:alkylhydroperoxidase family enzyme